MGSVKWVALLVIAVSAASALAGYSLRSPQVVESPPDTVEITDEEAERRVDELEIEVEGWRNRALGRHEAEPETIYVSEGRVDPPEVCTEAMRGSPGSITFGLLRANTPDSLAGTYSREIRSGYDIGKCQEFSLAGDRFVCDQPALGVLDVVGEGSFLAQDQSLGFAGRLGVSWRRYPVSGRSIAVYRDFISGEWEMRFTQKVNLFGGW